MKKLAIIFALSLVLLASVACTLDYRLIFSVDSWTYNNGIVNVDYSFQNTGNKTLYDIELGITVYYLDNSHSFETIVYCGNLQSFEKGSGKVDINIGNGYNVIDVDITSSGWNDSDGNNSIFD